MNEYFQNDSEEPEENLIIKDLKLEVETLRAKIDNLEQSLVGKDQMMTKLQNQLKTLKTILMEDSNW